MPTQSEQATGVQNTNYNLVSVLYHMLNGAATYKMLKSRMPSALIKPKSYWRSELNSPQSALS